MARKGFRKLVPLVLALALVTSGCFQIRYFQQKPDGAIGPDEVGKVYLRLYQVSQSEMNTDAYTFILIGIDADLKLKLVGNFDTKGNFGGPFTRVRDDDLRDVLIADDNCSANGISASDITGMANWYAYRTDVKMDSTAGGYNDPLLVHVRLKRNFADPDDRGDFVIFSGTWADLTGEGDPDPGEAVCAGMIFSSYSASE
ncbi:MAG: hypothetical protein KQH83_12660 [Actinobacteria bacterium]|nr:hypothetical protein [Actinomycetota bacterium]